MEQPRGTDRSDRPYHEVCRRELVALLEGEEDLIARMSTVAAVLFTYVPRVSFCGFYRDRGDGTLVVGPYQGPVGCLRIEPGRGVCGRAAAEGRSVVVPDVQRFPGHIACDPASRSELVVPVRDAAGKLIGVLDLDSREPAAFDEEDRRALESLLDLLFARLRPRD
jgi:L-methionine (R)-S-oxide reductase